MGTLIAVRDMEASKKFYSEVLGLEIISDFGANVTMTGGICLQTIGTWKSFINKEVLFGSNDSELYFEQDDIPAFLEHLKDFAGIRYVHRMIEHRWGQRAVRFYDPDDHIIEVGENMSEVVKRFITGGMSMEQTAIRMDVPLSFIKSCLK